jgi:hypothetical protein
MGKLISQLFLRLNKCPKIVISTTHHRFPETCDKRIVPGGRDSYCKMQWRTDFNDAHYSSFTILESNISPKKLVRILLQKNQIILIDTHICRSLLILLLFLSSHMVNEIYCKKLTFSATLFISSKQICNNNELDGKLYSSINVMK